jgi:16S rRNA (guanine966-N2)-methyltransferase
MTKNPGQPKTKQRVRIIAGRWRGRQLPVISSPGLRPTPNRVRETLFNWLQPVIAGVECLDLFAGTGALGLEAASRGAARVTLVEAGVQAAATIRSAIVTLDAGNARLIQVDALRYLAGPAIPQDLVFLDPPFDSKLLERSLRLLSMGAWIKRDAHVYLEADARRTPLTLPSDWRIDKEGRAGNVAYCLIRAGAGEAQRACSSERRWP